MAEGHNFPEEFLKKLEEETFDPRTLTEVLGLLSAEQRQQLAELLIERKFGRAKKNGHSAI